MFSKIVLTSCLICFPVISFVAGFTFGKKQVVVIAKADAPPAQAAMFKNIGDVAGATLSIPTEEVVELPVQHLEKTQIAGDDSLWDVVNQYREQNGLAVFIQDDMLCTLARSRLTEMVRRGSIDNHHGFNEQIEFYFKDKDFVKFAENLAQGYTNPHEVVTHGWDKSTPHKATLLATDMDRACTAMEGSFAILIAGRKP